jgi:UDP-3-O-[3-hydroxymyristoyl] glucosamine N-acyltransferase
MPEIHQIIESLKDTAPFQFIGRGDTAISTVVSAKEAIIEGNSAALAWINDENATGLNQAPRVGLLILSEKAYELFRNQELNFLVTENPRFVFMEILKKHFQTKRISRIESTAQISENVSIGENTYVGHNVIIESGSTIGSNCEILHNTVILSNTIIGDNTRIGCNCTIGNYGFGYEKDADQNWDLIEHLGAVVIGNNVHIHNNTCIDRAVLGKTIIEDNVKIDNLVHIAHGVHIKKNSLIIANAMVAGSTVIGENCWIAPSVSIKNKMIIPDNVNTGIGAVILKSPEPNQTVIGNPAISMEQYKTWSDLKKKLLKGEGDSK